MEQVKIKVGVEVSFRFLHWDHSKHNTGKGIVNSETIVGTDHAFSIKVTESDSYQPSEFIDVRARNVWAAQ